MNNPLWTLGVGDVVRVANSAGVIWAGIVKEVIPKFRFMGREEVGYKVRWKGIDPAKTDAEIIADTSDDWRGTTTVGASDLR